MEDLRLRRLSSHRRPGSAPPTRERQVREPMRAPSALMQARRASVLLSLGGLVKRWLRGSNASDLDLLNRFTDRVARASTTVEVRAALADAARTIDGEYRRENRETPGWAVPLRFGGKTLGSVTLAVDPSRWTTRQHRRLESLASVAAAAEIALGSTRRPGSASVAEPVRDAATGLPTAAFLETHLSQALALAKRRKESLILMAVAVDGLDRLREHDGEEFAEIALSLAARAVSGTLRASDLVVRLEGDRLAAVLPGAGKSDAIRVAEVLRRAVAEAGVASSVPATLSASVGIAAYPDDAHSPRSLRAASEQALQDGRISADLARCSRSGLDTQASAR